MPRNLERRVPAEVWWRRVHDNFERVTAQFVKKAQEAEFREKNHECGHLFTITVTSRGHYGIAGEGSASHRDAKYEDTLPRPVMVRAHNLRDALLIAAAQPTKVWFDEEANDAQHESAESGDGGHGQDHHASADGVAADQG